MRRLFVLMLALGHARAQQPATFTLPRPTGTYAVGSEDWFLTDSSRVDTLDDVTMRRRLKVSVWYPAPAGTRGAAVPYLRSGAAELEVIAGLMKRPASDYAAIVNARSHSINAAPAIAGKHPIIVLSHGYLSSPSVHTVVAEELASRGYVVLGVAHTGEAQAVSFPDGQVVKMVASSGKIAKRASDVFSEWGAEDSSMAAVSTATTDSARAAIMRRYLRTIPVSTRGVARWATDVRFVVDEAFRVARSRGARLSGRLDTLRLGAMGHSFGGVTAAEFCRIDSRCKAALNLDGIPQYGALLDSGATRPFLMMYSARAGRTGVSDVIYRHSSAPYWSVVLAESGHLDVSDWPLYGPTMQRSGVTGTVKPETAARLTARVVREWFDLQLRGRPSSLLSGKTTTPGLTVHPPR